MPELDSNINDKIQNHFKFNPAVDDKPPLVTLIRGLPGSGKTTLGLKLAERFGTTLIDIDNYYVNQKTRHFDIKHYADGMKYLLNALINALIARCDIIVVSYFIEKIEIEPFLRAINDYKADSQILTCKGEYKSKDYPDSSIQILKNKFWQDIPNEIFVTL